MLQSCLEPHLPPRSVENCDREESWDSGGCGRDGVGLEDTEQIYRVSTEKEEKGLGEEGSPRGPSHEAPEWIVYTHLLRLYEANK